MFSSSIENPSCDKAYLNSSLVMHPLLFVSKCSNINNKFCLLCWTHLIKSSKTLFSFSSGAKSTVEFCSIFFKKYLISTLLSSSQFKTLYIKIKSVLFISSSVIPNFFKHISNSDFVMNELSTVSPFK